MKTGLQIIQLEYESGGPSDWMVNVLAIGVERLDVQAVIDGWAAIYESQPEIRLHIAKHRRFAELGPFTTEMEAEMACAVLMDFVK